MPYKLSDSDESKITDDDDLERSTNKMMIAGAILMVVMVLIFPLYLSIEPTARSDARATQKASLISEGSHIFEQNCASCHGKNGVGSDSPALNSKQFLKKVTDKQIESIVSAGIPGTEMPAWSQDYSGPLTSGQITEVTAYLRSLEPNAPDRPDWRAMLTGG